MTALLLTGAPGIGKTTALTAAADRLRVRGLPVRGFVTREMREGGRRVGFEIETFGGECRPLAHVGIEAPHRVGRYGVDVEGFERIALPALVPSDDPRAVYLVDEIGKMECLSERFVEAMRALLDTGCPVAATVAKKGAGFIAGVKRREDVELWEVTRERRDALPEAIAQHVGRMGPD